MICSVESKCLISLLCPPFFTVDFSRLVFMLCVAAAARLFKFLSRKKCFAFFQRNDLAQKGGGQAVRAKVQNNFFPWLEIFMQKQHSSSRSSLSEHGLNAFFPTSPPPPTSRQLLRQSKEKSEKNLLRGDRPLIKCIFLKQSLIN